VIDKSVPELEAFSMAQKVIKNLNRTYYRETKDSWRFRNIPRTRFIPSSYVSRVINDKMTMIFGHLKDEA